MQTCPFCKGKIEAKYMSFDYKEGKKLYSIPNVKTLVCTNAECGERFYDEEGNKTIDDFDEEKYDRNRKQSNIS